MGAILSLLLTLLAVTSAEPLRLHPDNPHYFLYQGRPTVLIGSGEHYGAVINLDFDYEVYLETMAEEGQNLTRIFSGAYLEKPGAFGIEKNTLAPAEASFQPPWDRSSTPGAIGGGTKFDLERWNPAYFSRLKDFVGTAERHGIMVEVVLFSSIYSEENWRRMPFHPDNNINRIELEDWKKCNTLENGRILHYQELLVRKLVRELNPFSNVYFEIQNEPWPDQPDPAGFVLEHLRDDLLPDPWQNRVDLAVPASLKWQSTIAGFIADGEKDLPRKHLIAQNYCNYIYPLEKVDDKVSILNFHYALPECVGINYGWNRPLSFDESGFSGPESGIYLRQAWRFMLSGGAVFNGLDYSFYPGFENGKGKIAGPGGGGRELRLRLAILRRFLESFDLARMAPDRDSARLHPGLFVYLLSTPGRQYAGYLEGRGGGRLEMNLSPGEYQVAWIDTHTGDPAGESRLAVSSTSSASLQPPPFQGEIAFSIRRTSD